jgi:hypothetical protein
MQTLESLGNSLLLKKEGIERISPGVFASYSPMKKKSSQIELASTGGLIRKIKKRNPQKAIYEFLALEIWHDLLASYSDPSGLQFRAPKPIGVANLDGESPEVFMEFINGYELKRLGQLKRTTPVQIRGQKFPLPLYAACALHLGALNRIKEHEELYHEDYDDRHVLFSPIENVSMGVIDVENSRNEPLASIQSESKQIYDAFFSKVSSEKDRQALHSWYEQGTNILVPGLTEKRLPAILETVGKKYDIDLDFTNMVLNGVRLKS